MRLICPQVLAGFYENVPQSLREPPASGVERRREGRGDKEPAVTQCQHKARETRTEATRPKRGTERSVKAGFPRMNKSSPSNVGKTRELQVEDRLGVLQVTEKALQMVSQNLGDS